MPYLDIISSSLPKHVTADFRARKDFAGDRAHALRGLKNSADDAAMEQTRKLRFCKNTANCGSG